jgi:hypothetical protein
MYEKGIREMLKLAPLMAKYSATIKTVPKKERIRFAGRGSTLKRALLYRIAAAAQDRAASKAAASPNI